MPERAELPDILADARRLIEGAAHPTRRTLSVSPEVAALLERVVPAAPAAPGGEPAPPETPETRELAELARTVSTCTRCRLCEGRTQTVFADGSPHAELVFVGEAPGYEEDRQGLPFVGPAGQLLTKIIEKGMMLKRSDVYICNVLKCRPPSNRDPRPDEVAACEPYLLRQIELIRTKVICALGAHAAHTLLKTAEPTGRLRGKWHFYHGIPVRVTYHPAYLLRNPADKRKTWDDVREVMRVLRGEVTPEPEPPAPENRDLWDG